MGRLSERHHLSIYSCSVSLYKVKSFLYAGYPMQNPPFGHHQNRHRFPVIVLAALGLALFSCTPRTMKESTGSGIPTLPEACQANFFAKECTNPFFKDYANSEIPWQPWRREILEMARQAGRPVLVHVGYSTCPFSRQFRNSCLNDPEVAAMFRDHFLCVLADAESNLPTNHLLLETLPRLGSAPAWPILAWLTPEGLPFRAHDFAQSNGFSKAKVLESADRAWKEWQTDSDFVRRRSRSLAETIDNSTQVGKTDDRTLESRTVEDAFFSVSSSYDVSYGTACPGQNFPRPTTLTFLLALSEYFPKDGFRSGQCREMALNCLRKMADGAIHDYLDGGFHRYSEKPNWNAPHSEKMAADQAMVAEAYLEAARLTGDENLRETGFATLDQMIGTWSLPDGLLGHASTAFDTTREPGEQPPFLAPWFTWSAQEIKGALSPEEWQVVSMVNGIHERGNLPPALYSPHFGTRCNVLALFVPPEQAATVLGLDAATVTQRLSSAKAKLSSIRKQRPGFMMDDRSTVTANALAVAALGKAAKLPGGERFSGKAQAIFDRLRSVFVDAEGRLKGGYAWQGRVAEPPACHLDYAAMIQATLAVHELHPTKETLDLAEKLQASAREIFFDAEIGAFRAYSADQWTGVGKPWIVIGDAAAPSDNAIAAANLRRLVALTGSKDYSDTRAGLLALSRSNSSQTLTAHALMTEVVVELVSRPTADAVPAEHSPSR